MKMNSQPFSRWRVAEQSSRASDDWYVLDEMKAALRDALNAGLLKCAELARELSIVDPDTLMTELRCKFDPMQLSAIQDSFSDGFSGAISEIIDGGQPITARPALPSGAPLHN